MTINEIVKKAHQNAVDKGFWEENKTIGDLISLCHSELSEALEEAREGNKIEEIYYKNKKPCGVPVELADCVIRIMDICGQYNIDLEKIINEKMRYNTTRPYKHNKKF